MHIINNKHIWVGIGLGLMAVSVLLVAIFGLRLGIDFTGGSLTEVSYDVRPDRTHVESALEPLSLGTLSIRDTTEETGKDGLIIRTRDLSETERQSMEEILKGTGEGAEINRFTSIGPVIGQELRDKAVWAIGGVALIIILYVAFAFSGLHKPVGSFVYGGITIFVLVHDVLVPTALMALLGYFLGTEVDVLFVMAVLAVLGYSVNDTIVVFDRVRENLLQYRKEHKTTKKNELGQPEEVITYSFEKPFAEIVDESVMQTLLRSINTSVTTFVALGALYYFGGEVTQTFSLVLMAGIVAGTYSSIFFASPLLVYIAERQAKKDALVANNS